MADPQTVSEALKQAPPVVPGPKQDRQPLSDQEKRELFARLRDAQGRSRLKVDAPVGWVPLWARKNDPECISYCEYRGYSIVREDDPKHPRYKAPGLQSDGTYVISDVILMECRQEVFDAHQEYFADLARQQAEGAEEDTKQKLESAGAPTFGTKGKKR
jgi:hypothetical protein